MINRGLKSYSLFVIRNSLFIYRKSLLRNDLPRIEIRGYDISSLRDYMGGAAPFDKF
jgi:hypothetical protein